jgi:hypothetical protein
VPDIIQRIGTFSIIAGIELRIKIMPFCTVRGMGIEYMLRELILYSTFTI